MPLKQKMACLRLLFTSSTCDVLVSVRLLVASVSGRPACQTEGCPREASQAVHRQKNAEPTAPWLWVLYFSPWCLCSARLRCLTDISAAYVLCCRNQLYFGEATHTRLSRLKSRGPTQVDVSNVVRLLDVVPGRCISSNLPWSAELLTLVKQKR